MLFISSTTGGGSGRSQRELARRLIARGHDVAILVDDKRPARLRRWFYGHASDANVRWAAAPARQVRAWIEGRPGRAVDDVEIEGMRHRVTPIPQNAFGGVVDEFAPDVVVGNSVVRLTWRRIRSICRERGIPTVLYVREVATYGHVEKMDDAADVLVANAESLAARVRAEGYDCAFIPSAIDTTATATESNRTAAQLINPIPSHGLDRFWSIAARLPHRPFLLQESWPLDDTSRAAIEQRLADHPNVTFRARIEPGPELYGMARVLLVPHQIDNRPRVVAEAQANAIPAIASNFPGLAEAVGDGGVLLPSDSAEAWCDHIERTWSDPEWYDELCVRALAHSRRAEIDPDVVVDRFLEEANRAIGVANTPDDAGR